MSDVQSHALFVSGIKNDFADTYTKFSRQSDPRIQATINLNVGSDGAYEEYGFTLAAGHPEHWGVGEAIPTEGFGSVGWQTPNVRYAKRCQWKRTDRINDRTGTVTTQANQIARGFALLPERFTFDLITGTANTLVTVPNAADGVPAYNQTDGNGDPRYGVPNTGSGGGNIVTGQTVASEQAILTAFYAGIQRIADFQDGKGQPLYTDGELGSSFVVVAPNAHREKFERAFFGRRIGETRGTDAGVTPTNIVSDAEKSVMLWNSPRLTGNDWYLFLAEPPKQPFYLQTREGLRERTLNWDNSDMGATYDLEAYQWVWYGNAAISECYQTVKLTA